MMSLTIKSGELGDSDGTSRRMEMVGGTMDEASENKWGMGLRDKDGIESVGVGVILVGGSYLFGGEIEQS